MVLTLIKFCKVPEDDLSLVVESNVCLCIMRLFNNQFETEAVRIV